MRRSMSVHFVIANAIVEAFTVLAVVYSSKGIGSLSNFQLVQRVFPQIVDEVNDNILLSRIALVNVDLKLIVSLQASSYSRNINTICHHLYENISWREEVCKNCISDIIRQNIIVKANSISQDVNLSQSSIQFDGNIIYSHYLYSSGGVLSGSTVCAIGYFLPTSIISLLLMNPSNKLVYISFMEDIREDDFYEDLRSLQSMFSNFHLRMKDESPDCATIHILGVVKNLAELERYLQWLPSSIRVQNIVWEKIYENFENYLDVAIPYGESQISSQAGVIEFDSVGRWLGGKADYSGNFDYDEIKNVFNVTCSFFSNYTLIRSQPIEVYMGAIRSVADNYEQPVDCDQVWVEDSMYFITYEDSMFIETAEGIADALHRASFLNVEIMGRFNRTTYLRLRNNYCKNSLVQISIGGDGLHILTKRYILFHTENRWGRFSQLSHYNHIVRHAAAVLVYSSAHMKDIRRIGREDGIFLIPMYSKTVHSTQVKNAIRHHREFDTIPNDLLALMSLSERRQSVLNQLLVASFEDNITIIVPNQKMEIVKQIQFSDIQTRDFLSLQSKIFVNIHQHHESVLETHRVNNLLSLGVCVVSEHSYVDHRLDAEYQDTVYFFTTFEELYATVKELLSNESMLRNCYKKSLEKFNELMSDTDGLVEALTYAHSNRFNK